MPRGVVAILNTPRYRPGAVASYVEIARYFEISRAFLLCIDGPHQVLHFLAVFLNTISRALDKVNPPAKVAEGNDLNTLFKLQLASGKSYFYVLSTLYK